MAKHILILRPGTSLCHDIMPQLRSALTKAYDASLAYNNVKQEVEILQSHDKWTAAM